MAGDQIKLDAYQRGMQKAYVGSVIEFLTLKDAKYIDLDAASVLRADMEQLKDLIDSAVSRTKDPSTLYHLKDVLARIKATLNPKPGSL